VHKVGLHLSSAPKALAKSYNLTPGELRVLLGIVHIGGVQETAEALGVGENTVKTHLQRVYAKTGAGRQAEIVKLAAEFSNPFVN
jgi:DNA-binding CsgD family transcriptional regulator